MAHSGWPRHAEPRQGRTPPSSLSCPAPALPSLPGDRSLSAQHRNAAGFSEKQRFTAKVQNKVNHGGFGFGGLFVQGLYADSHAGTSLETGGVWGTQAGPHIRNCSPIPNNLGVPAPTSTTQVPDLQEPVLISPPPFRTFLYPGFEEGTGRWLLLRVSSGLPVEGSALGQRQQTVRMVGFQAATWAVLRQRGERRSTPGKSRAELDLNWLLELGHR